tara:strand:+ start:1999 stop:2364 length:366 start_codon:yes stop_codon:yes gene_type:complete
MLAVIVLAIVIYFASSLVKTRDDISEIHALIRESYKYSGLNQSIHQEFIQNIKMALEHRRNILTSKRFLKRALENLNEIALSSISGDTNVLEEIDTIISAFKTSFENLYERIKNEDEDESE